MTCPNCGGPVEKQEGRGRPRTYCSRACKDAVNLWQRKCRANFADARDSQKERAAVHT